MKKSSFYAVLMVTISLFIAASAISDNATAVTVDDENGSVTVHDPTLLLTSASDIQTVYVPE